MGDLRTRKTLRSLKTAFLELLEQYRFEEITVGMLCQRAEIRRATFYTHFADKFEFFFFFIQEMRKEFSEHIAGENQKVEKETETYYENLFHELVLFFKTHPELVQNLKKSQMLPMMMQIFAEEVVQNVRGYLDGQGGQDSNLNEMKAHFYAGGILQLLQLWMDKPEEFEVDSLNWLNYICR